MIIIIYLPEIEIIIHELCSSVALENARMHTRKLNNEIESNKIA